MSASYTVGDGKTYTVDIQDAIDDIPGDLSGEGKQWVQVYYAAAGYAEILDINAGFSNASDNVDYVDVEAMVSHGGLRGQGIVLSADSAAVAYKITMGAYSKFHGFCVTYATWKAASSNSVFVDWAAGRCYIYDNVVYDCQSDAGQSMLTIYQWAGKITAFNNQFFNLGNVTGNAQGIYLTGAGAAGNEHRLINNIIYNCKGPGIAGGGLDYILCHNNYSHVSTNYCFAGLNAAHTVVTYNISSDATADDWGGTGNLISKAAANQFVDVSAGTENLHLKSTADCFRNGADMSRYFTHDCVNIPRKFWRTGAFETLPGVYSVNDGNPHKVYYSWGGNLAKVDGVDVPLRNTESMVDNDEATIQVGQFSGGIQSGGLIGDLRIYDSPDVKDTRG